MYGGRLDTFRYTGSCFSHFSVFLLFFIGEAVFLPSPSKPSCNMLLRVAWANSVSILPSTSAQQTSVSFKTAEKLHTEQVWTNYTWMPYELDLIHLTYCFGIEEAAWEKHVESSNLWSCFICWKASDSSKVVATLQRVSFPEISLSSLSSLESSNASRMKFATCSRWALLQNSYSNGRCVSARLHLATAELASLISSSWDHKIECIGIRNYTSTLSGENVIPVHSRLH